MKQVPRKGVKTDKNGTTGDRATIPEVWHGGAVPPGAAVRRPTLAYSPDFLFKPLFSIFVQDLPGSPLATFWEF